MNKNNTNKISAWVLLVLSFIGLVLSIFVIITDSAFGNMLGFSLSVIIMVMFLVILIISIYTIVQTKFTKIRAEIRKEMKEE